jgi:Fic family protein
LKRSDFLDSPSGRLVETDRGQWAFVPNDLPPPIDLRAFAPELGRALQLIGELNGIGRTLRDPYLLIRPLEIQEALASSSIEGTFSTATEIVTLEAVESGRDQRSDAREVANYRAALSEAIAELDAIPLSIRTLLNAHRRLMTGVPRNRGGNWPPGELKTTQNAIGGSSLENARFIPPPPLQAREALGKLEVYIQRENRGGIPDLVDAALIHYQFETIHPFPDGNGRVGRMLVALHLHMRQVLRRPFLYLSPAIERRKDEYVDRMFAVSRSGEWDAWIRFFLEIVAEASEATIETADRLLELERTYRERVSRAGRSLNLQRIADLLFSRPAISIPRIAEFLGVTYRSAQLNIAALERVGILTESPSQSNPKIFIARDIIDIIENKKPHARSSA